MKMFLALILCFSANASDSITYKGFLGDPVPLKHGGTGHTTQQTAINGLAGAVTTAQFLRGNGTNVVMSAIQTTDVPTLNQSTTSSAGSISGTNVVTNSNLSQMTANTIKGNNTGSTANAADLTVANVNAILPVFTSTLNGLVPLSGGGTTNYLRADGTWTAGSSGANTALSNLITTAINQNL